MSSFKRLATNRFIKFLKMIKRILQLFILTIPIALFAWLLAVDISPGGEFVVLHDVETKTPFIDRILPDDRVLPTQYNSAGQPFTTLVDEPTYFSVHFPNTNFDRVILEVLFDNSHQAILEVGALADIFSQSFDLRPLHNLIIENLDWNQVQGSEVTLYDRNGSYSDIGEFFQEPPARSQIATYHYDFDVPYRLPFYEPLSGERAIDVSLRGFHKFVTYVKDEPVRIELTYMDMNRLIGEDEVRVTVRNENDEIVYEQVMKDDGNTVENQISSTKTIIINDSGWPEGVYSVDLSGTSDIFWREITTSLRYVTFVNTIYLADDVGHLPEPRGTVFFTNAKNFAFETLHAESAQNLGVGENEVQVPLSHEKVRASITDVGVVQGNSPRGDIKIVGDGKFSFSRDAFFDPDPVRLTGLTDLDALGIDYVLTTYTSPDREGDWYKQTAEFEIASIQTEDRDATFTLSAPLIGEEQNTVDIHAINLVFEKDPMTFKQFLGAIRERLPFGL